MTELTAERTRPGPGRHVPRRPDLPTLPAAQRAGTWIGFAVLLVGALLAIPFGVHLAHASTAAASTSSTRPDPAPASGGAGVPDSWSTFRASDGSFSILGPADRDVRTLSTGLGPAHEAVFGDGSLSVAWTDASNGSSDAKVLQSEVSRILGPLQGMTVDEERLRDGVAPGFGLSFDSGGTHYRLRIFAHGGRLFEIVATAPARSSQAKLGNAFVSSFLLD